MIQTRGRSSGMRASRRRVDYSSSGEYQDSECQNDPGLQELHDLGNKRRERITTSEIPQKRSQPAQAPSLRDSDKLGTAAAQRAEQDRPLLDAWKNGLNDIDPNTVDLADIGQGQTHRANLTHNMRIHKADQRERGLEPDAENADNESTLQDQTGGSRSGGGHNKPFPNVHHSDRRRPLDPAVDQDRPYGYKDNKRRNRQGRSQNNSSAFEGVQQSQTSSRTQMPHIGKGKTAPLRQESHKLPLRDAFPANRLATDASHFTTYVATLQNSRTTAAGARTNHSQEAFSKNSETLQTTKEVDKDGVGVGNFNFEEIKTSNTSIQMPPSDPPTVMVQPTGNKESKPITEGDEQKEIMTRTAINLSQNGGNVPLAFINANNPALKSEAAFWKQMDQIRFGSNSSNPRSMARNIPPEPLPPRSDSPIISNLPPAVTGMQAASENTPPKAALKELPDSGFAIDVPVDCETKPPVLKTKVSASSGDTKPSMSAGPPKPASLFTRHPKEVEKLDASVTVASPVPKSAAVKVDQQADVSDNSTSSNIRRRGFRRIDDDRVEFEGYIIKMRKIAHEEQKAEKNPSDRSETNGKENKATEALNQTTSSRTADSTPQPSKKTCLDSGGLGDSKFADKESTQSILKEKSTNAQANQAGGIVSKKSFQNGDVHESALHAASNIDNADTQTETAMMALNEQTQVAPCEAVHIPAKEDPAENQDNIEDVSNSLEAQACPKALDIDLNQVQTIPEMERRRTVSFVIPTKAEHARAVDHCQHDPMEELSVRLSKCKIQASPRKN